VVPAPDEPVMEMIGCFADTRFTPYFLKSPREVNSGEWMPAWSTSSW
jgi:hypothetical protein